MKIKDIYKEIYDYENLCNAFWKASKGKHNRKEVIKFKKNFYKNIDILKNQIISKKLDIGNYRYFKVFDPKPRDICAASFPERILHHAIMNHCEPILDKYAIDDSFACRKEKGTHRAIKRAQFFSRKNDWFLKMDIKKYFNSIDHYIALKLMSKLFKDPDLIILFQKILETYSITPGKGVPIGNLISQHLANYYLGSFDHWIKEELKIKGYIRYMDDFIVFRKEKKQLKEDLKLIEDFLLSRLELKLKENTILNRCQHGIPFLGLRVFPYKVLLNQQSKKRFVIKFRAYERKFLNGVWDQDTLIRHMLPLVEFTKSADSGSFRQSIIDRFGVPS